MAKITFVTSDGETKVLEAEKGSVMELAVAHGVSGIDGDCGGVCSCATCHVHVAEEDFEKVGGPSDIERDMLELEDNVNAFSRLSCQLKITDDLDGLVLQVAK